MIPFRWNNPAFLSIYTGAPFPVDQVLGVSIDSGVGEHDMVKMRCSGISASVLSSLDQMPIMVEWGSNTGTRMRFAGYVSVTGAVYSSGTTGIAQGLQPAPLKSISINCLGATTAFRDGGRDLWQDRSIQQVANDIAAKYRFSIDCSPNSFLWPRLAMNGMSYWQFLNQLAEMVGYDLIGNGTHLRLLDPVVALASSRNVPVLQTRQVFRGLNSGATLLAEFKPKISSHTADAHLGPKVITGLDQVTGQIFTLNTSLSVQDDTGFGRFRPQSANTLTPVVSANSYGMATALAQGIDRQMLWATTATATTATGVDMMPGDVTYVQGFSADFDGLWYVRRAVHNIDIGTYSVTLELGKDALGVNTAQAKPAPASTLIPQSQLLNNRWVASTQQVVPSNV